MSSVHYFQRYSQRENVVTNNTLLLLSRIQAHDPRALGRVLNALLDSNGEELSIGVKFSQQVSAGQTIPDGTMLQSSFRVILETKMSGASFSFPQLDGHLSGFKNDETRILLLLSPTEPQISEEDRKKLMSNAARRLRRIRF
jgi:hypothetical protein